MSAESTSVFPKVKGNPASAQPIAGLSERAQKRLRPTNFAQRMSVAPTQPVGTIQQAFRAVKD